MSVTMDPESNKDGTFKPRNSMVMDGHCETALFKIRCLASDVMAQLDKVFTICSNLSSNLETEDGSNLAPPLHPRPWGAGAFSLNPPWSFLVWLWTCVWLQAWDSSPIDVLCPCSSMTRLVRVGNAILSRIASLEGRYLPKKWLALSRLLITSISSLTGETSLGGR